MTKNKTQSKKLPLPLPRFLRACLELRLLPRRVGSKGKARLNAI